VNGVDQHVLDTTGKRCGEEYLPIDRGLFGKRAGHGETSEGVGGAGIHHGPVLLKLQELFPTTRVFI
jgi:hypothetical protein